MRPNQFHLVFQPLINAKTQKLVGFEALIRWNHPQRGFVPPNVFIPVAEESGLMPAIGEWVIDEACKAAATWPEPITVALNISPKQIILPALPNIVSEALARYKLAGNRIELEVTEGVFLGDNGSTLDVLKRLRALGVGIALDDFGTGYSSIGYLNKAVFHKLKIDGSFVREAGSRPENVAIIQSIVQLAKSFRMSVTAEGVETAEDFERMRDLGCDTIQGYLFGRPLPYDRANQMVVGLGSEAPGRLILRLLRLPRTTLPGSRGARAGASHAKNLFKYQSGRVIALGRVMLAAMFLVAIWLDRASRRECGHRRPTPSCFSISCFALAIAAATWTNWWLDARLAVPTHVVDMAVFAVIVFSTNGYTSPFFLVFILPLLSAAIRWGWRETALTAAALVLLFFSGGMLVAGSVSFELQRFVVRTAHLVILSSILIWFGMHQRFTGLFVRLDDFDSLIGQGESAGARASRGDGGGRRGHRHLARPVRCDGAYAGLRIEGGAISGPSSAPGHWCAMRRFGNSMLFDVARDRALTKTARSWSRLAGRRPSSILAKRAASASARAVAQVRCGTAEGWLVLEGIPELSADYINLGRELGRAAGSMLDRSTLVSAIEESVAAQTRLSLARDVHDSIVQFLAGASFRVEAIARAARSGKQVDADLTELKRLLVEEQTEIRSFVSALRREREIELGEVVEDLRALAVRLSQQWSIDCKISTAAEEAADSRSVFISISSSCFAKRSPTRFATAAPIRSGSNLAVADDLLQLDVSDNGRGFAPVNGGSLVEPWSLKERVDRAHGSLMLVSQPGRTDISISLPLAGAAA